MKNFSNLKQYQWIHIVHVDEMKNFYQTKNSCQMKNFCQLSSYFSFESSEKNVHHWKHWNNAIFVNEKNEIHNDRCEINIKMTHQTALKNSFDKIAKLNFEVMKQ